MTDGLSRGRTTLHRIVRLGLACACLLVVSAQAVAARVTVVLSDDSAPYQEVYQAIRAYLDDTSHEVIQVYAERLNAVSLNESRLAVAVGVRAAESLAALPVRPPVLAVLVPRAWYVKTGRARLSDGGGRRASAIYLDQPFERQVRLIRQAFPEARRVGMLVSAEQSGLVGELDDALQAQRLSLAHVTLSGEERLITALENVLSDAELLLAVPDPLIFNRNTAQSLFLTSYRYRVPVLGYSRSLTRAGALLSLHSSPAQIGRQTAEWVKGAIQGVPVNLPPPAHPAYFSISINEQVARSLGFTLPPEVELEKRLGGGY
ncbi:MAG: ABC transporter substrate binding protein [Thiobacillus sp.]|nr:ABC transporter substrate binding protein [Thiobacillus sp.]MDP2978899.1 ABC transporter substrate binding protein [Thiobacillus sp.]